MDMADKMPYTPPALDMSHLITEDDTPVDNRFSERQQRLLPHILFSSWKPGRPFEALGNVGIFSSLDNKDTIVPDFLLSLDVEPRPVTGAKEDRSYFLWIYGKAPDLVIEIVSNREGKELGSKLDAYAKIRVTYYAIYDPFARLGKRPLRIYRLVEGRYMEMASSAWLPEVGLGLGLWEGEFEGVTDRWLRFVDEAGRWIPTAQESRDEAESARDQAQADAATAKRSIQEMLLTLLSARFGSAPPAERLAELSLPELSSLAQKVATCASLEEVLEGLPGRG